MKVLKDLKENKEGPLVDKKKNFPGVRAALERQEADGNRKAGRQQ